MKRLVVFALAIAVPLAVLVNVRQSIEYRSVMAEVRRLENVQRTLIEDNKRLITEVSLFSSPARIGGLVDSLPELRPVGRDVVYIGDRTSRFEVDR